MVARMTLPYDMARCEAKKCEQRNKCARFTSPWRPVGYQVVRDFEAFLVPAKGCDYFIGDENESKKERLTKPLDATANKCADDHESKKDRPGNK
jgi:hypothetical protein